MPGFAGMTLLINGSAVEFDHVEAAHLVGEIDETAVIPGHVVGPRYILPGRRLRDEEAAFGRIRRILDVDDPQAGNEPGDVEQTILVDLLPQLMGAEAHMV